MKKFNIACLLYLCLFFSTPKAYSQFVTIPDANFVAWLNTHGYAGCMNGNQMDTTCSSVISVKTVFCSLAYISNLTGIQYFDNLDTLICYSNFLVNLPKLPPKLKVLGCAHNQLTALPILPAGLIEINCSYNQLSSLPPLPNTINWLVCIGNLISNLPSLPNSLVEFDCAINLLTTLPPLPVNLTKLSCAGNLLTSLPALPPALILLTADRNYLTTIPPLPNTLLGLSVGFNQLTSIPTIPNKLILLKCSSNQLKSLPLLNDTMNELTINDNPGITCLPSIKKLLTFKWYNTGITCLSSSLTVTNLVDPPIFNVPICAANPATPGTITGSNNGCPGDFKLYTIRKITNAASYLWTPPIGATINGSSATFATPDTFVIVTFTPSFNGDTLRVRSVSCRGTGTGERKLRINKNVPSTPGTIAGLNIGLCNKSNVTFTINAVNNALNYTWRSIIAGVLFNGNASPYTTSLTSVNVTFGTFITGQLYVKANNNCGSSAERSLTVNAKPAVPSIINGPSTVCDGDTGSFSTVAVANALTYNWTSLSGSSIITGQGTTSAKIKFGNVAASGLVRVRSQNSCASSAYVTKSVTVNNCPRIMGVAGQSQLTIQPNPFSTSTTIILPSNIDLENCELHIYDIFGKSVLKITHPSNYSINIDRGNLASGLYNVLLFSGKTMEQSVKMIIK